MLVLVLLRSAVASTTKGPLHLRPSTVNTPDVGVGGVTRFSGLAYAAESYVNWAKLPSPVRLTFDLEIT